MKSYEEGYKDFEAVMAVLEGLFMKALDDQIDIAAIMAATSISLVRLAKATGVDKQQLKERLMRDIEIMYLEEAQFDKEKMQ